MDIHYWAYWHTLLGIWTYITGYMDIHYWAYGHTLLGIWTYITLTCHPFTLAFQQKAEKLQAALDKLKELDEIICTLQRELDVLRPLMAAAEQDVQQRMALITAAKER